MKLWEGRRKGEKGDIGCHSLSLDEETEAAINGRGDFFRCSRSSVEIEATLSTQPLPNPELTQKAGEADLNSVQQPP